ncbi:MAG: hypothetical protein H0U10_04025 [Chloroflexia bacterium]|nr:hypothetical protein [Chloroflexia bacterium]
MSVAALAEVGERIGPMLRLVAAEYRGRTPEGYPVVVDAAASGTVGIELDPMHALYVTSDGDQLYADLYYRASRNDTRSSASREKFGGMPTNDRRPLPDDVSPQHLRNLLAELMSRWNFQPGIIHITDS